MNKSIIFLLMILLISFVGCQNEVLDVKPELKKLNLKKSVTDIDGNVYGTTEIAGLVWMTANFKATKLNDSTPLLLTTSFYNTVIPAFIEHPSEIDGSIFRRYNFYAIRTGKLAPVGWHVANKEDWALLTQQFTPEDVMIKSEAWDQGIKTKNSTDFSALPGQTYWWNPFFPFIDRPNSEAAICLQPAPFSWMWMGFIGESDVNCSAIRCVQDCKPLVVTDNISEITSVSAKIQGRLLNKGGLLLSESGFCINTSKNPTIENTKVVTELYRYSGESVLSDLKPNTKYFVRAFATNSIGTGYGEDIEFTTAPL